jgi:hypothetical protein
VLACPIFIDDKGLKFIDFAAPVKQTSSDKNFEEYGPFDDKIYIGLLSLLNDKFPLKIHKALEIIFDLLKPQIKLLVIGLASLAAHGDRLLKFL